MLRTVCLLLVLITLTACSGGEDTSTPTLRPVSVSMGFIPDPQYAPFYVADSLGFYAEAGLEVTFDYSSETDGVTLVAAGELPFAIVSGEQVILARAQELPVVYVLEWFQRFPIAVISKASKGITTPADLAGRSVGLPGLFGASYVGYVGLLAEAGLTQDDVASSEIGYTQMEALRTDQVDAVVGYANNEPVQLAAQGESINVIYVADYIDMVANGIIASEDLVQTEPEMVSAFIRATLRGLAATLADPDAAFETSKQYVEDLDDSRRPVLTATLPLWEADTLGMTDTASWERTQDVLLEASLLDAPLADLEAAFTNQFVQDAQPVE